MRIALLSVLLPFWLVACGESTGAEPLTVTYIANCGFIIETGEHEVIVDGLLASDVENYYFTPTDSVVDLMRRAEAPFDNVDLALFTHNHQDHFSAEVTADFLLANPEAIAIGPPQVREQLATTENFGSIQERVMAVTAPADSIVELSFGGITVRALPSEHGSYYEEDSITGETVDRHAAVQHVEYVIKMGGRTVYHAGDALLNDSERYRSFGFGDTTIAAVMVQWWDEREMISFTQKLIRDVFRPENIFLMHMLPNRSARGNPENQADMPAEIFLPDSLMQRWVIE